MLRGLDFHAAGLTTQHGQDAKHAGVGAIFLKTQGDNRESFVNSTAPWDKCAAHRSRGFRVSGGGVAHPWRAVGRYGVLLGLLLSLLLAACSPSPLEDPAESAAADEIVLYNWAEDIPQEILDAFTEEFGVEVRYKAYESQEEVYANILAGQSYDVAVVDNDYLPEFLAEEMLAEIDYANVPNFTNIAANFRDLSYDPHNTHSIPYSWGTSALLVRTDLLENPITRWADLWELPPGAKVGFRVDEPREPMGVALMALGYSLNTESPDEIQAAAEHLQKISGSIVPVVNYAEGAVPLLADGEIVALVGWSEDALFAQDEGIPVEYVYPQEGAMLWGDNFVIPSNSSNKDKAELFLDFLLRPEIGAQIVNDNYYASANEAAFPLIDPEIRENSVLYPADDVMRNAEVFLPISPEAYDMYTEKLAEGLDIR